jgi:hypothetical protein
MSQSDEDDGLPQSPVPHVTTADLILGGGLKVLASISSNALVPIYLLFKLFYKNTLNLKIPCRLFLRSLMSRNLV